MSDAGGSDYFIDLDEAPILEQMEGVETQVLTGLNGEGMMMVLTTIQPGFAVPEHAHVHEQIGFIVSGTADMTIAEEERPVSAGDTYGIPPDVPHSALATGNEPFVALDIFHPVRADFLEKLGR